MKVISVRVNRVMQERRERGGGCVVRRRAGVLPGARGARRGPAAALRRAGAGAAARAPPPAPRPLHAAALTAAPTATHRDTRERPRQGTSTGSTHNTTITCRFYESEVPIVEAP